MKKRKAHIDKDCVACGNCISNCPLKAITIYKGLFALVDTEKCVGCGRCVKACPAGVIEIKVKEIMEDEKSMV